MLNEKEGIIVVVATKDRIELLKKSLRSISEQTKEPLDVFVSSDSSKENAVEEKDLCDKYGFNYLKNKYTHNYAGNLNSAIEAIFAKYAYDNRYNLDNLFIALLDDDDFWHSSYLRECWSARTDETDIVVSGLIYHTDNKDISLSIPSKINIDSFLKGNPHIQGSNTFVRFSTLLKAGCFDENMDSTTDRDLFTRLLMLNPNISIVDKYLVEIDASILRNRLTNDKEGKKLSLAKFYYKYGSLMNEDVKKEFFERAKTFTNIKDENELRDVLISRSTSNFDVSNSSISTYTLEKFPKLCISFITTNINYAKRLIDDICNADYPSKKIIIFANLESSLDFDELNKKLKETSLEFSIISLNEAKSLAETGYFGRFVKDNFPNEGIVKDIAVARTILQYFAYKNSSDEDVIYVLDEDMRLQSIYRTNNKFEVQKANIKEFVSKYYGKVDAVIGSYSGDAPLPSLSTLRCSLLDYVYTKKLDKNSDAQEDLYNAKDYYYSFSDEGNLCNETPFPLLEKCTLKDILGGKAVSRPLFESTNNDIEPSRRGGNTLIFNRNLLLIPNLSIQIGDYISRRSDSFWVILAKEKGYKIVGSNFSLYQNRISYDFNLDDEFTKEASDIFGYAMLEAYSKAGLSSRTRFYEEFIKAVRIRTVKFSISYFRVIGLLNILNEEGTDTLKEDELVYNFIRKIKEITDQANVNAGFDELNSYIALDECEKQLESIEQFLRNKLECNNLQFLGHGAEGAIYSSNGRTFKVFFSKDGLDFFKSSIAKLNEIEGLPKNIIFDDSLGYAYCSYDSTDNCKIYEGGHSKELAHFINNLRLNGFVITNIKKENFLISSNKIFYIDLGRGIVRYGEEDYKRSVERCYQMIKYSNLNKHQFRILISRSYLDKRKPYNYDLEVFNELIKDKRKEQTHDPIIIDLINKHYPGSVLDYGAGKCKIANSIAEKFNTYVYDIDSKTLESRASKKVNIIEDISKVERTFDLINCNKVLCCTDKETNENILQEISGLLNPSGRLILSICNPFFDNIDHTATTIKKYEGNYEDSNSYNKVTIYGERKEYHRPFVYYERLLSKYGFEIENIYEDRGIDTTSLSFISDHLIFDCYKKNKNQLSDCSLLIKVNPMEADTIYENIKHIVSQLEKNDIFEERIVTVDADNISRVRRYADDNNEKLYRELSRLKEDGFIDRIISLNLPDDYSLYEKYFSLKSNNVHSLNGQCLLSTLKGFESCNTRYVFQTDSDILYFNDGKESLDNALNVLKNRDAVTLSLSIAHGTCLEPMEGTRAEVRSSFIDLKKLKERLPFSNDIQKNTIEYGWHRCLDKVLEKGESIRLISNHLFFIHPENEIKQVDNILSVVRSEIEHGFVPTIQLDQVNLKESFDWIPKTNKEMVIFIRGRNTSCIKLKRPFSSLEEQDYQDFQVVYIDDNSSDLSSMEYIRVLKEYNAMWKDKLIYIRNEVRKDSLCNFEFFYKHICINPKSIIVNTDSDDALIGRDALSIIKERFDSGCDLTIGNCFRIDKPLKKYNLVSFKECWKRNGDNIWLHPKCFRRYLCEFIQDWLYKDGNYIDVATDYAMMLPLVENAHSPSFINEQIYLYDTSDENKNCVGVYGNKYPLKMKNWLLDKAHNISKYPTIAVIGDGNIQDKNEYEVAFNLGKKFADLGFNIKNGGLGGVMEAVFKGAKTSTKYRQGSTIALIPSFNRIEANQYADVVITTGLDLLRNGLVIDADAVVVIGGGAGTLSEISYAWQKYKLIIALSNIEGWGKKLVGQKLDQRTRYSNIPEDCIYSASNVDEVINLLMKYLNLYKKKYNGIKWRKN